MAAWRQACGIKFPYVDNESYFPAHAVLMYLDLISLARHDGMAAWRQACGVKFPYVDNASYCPAHAVLMGWISSLSLDTTAWLLGDKHAGLSSRM